MIRREDKVILFGVAQGNARRTGMIGKLTMTILAG